MQLFQKFQRQKDEPRDDLQAQLLQGLQALAQSQKTWSPKDRERSLQGQAGPSRPHTPSLARRRKANTGGGGRAEGELAGCRERAKEVPLPFINN